MSLRFDPILKEKDKVEREKELSLLGSGLKLGDPPLPPEGKPLFRGDGRPPSLMFSGITARGTNTDLYSHVFPPGKYTNSYSSQESAYISTSKSKEMATTFPKELRPGTQETYVYEIHVKQPVIDVASELMSNPKITRDPLALDLLRYEKEMAVPFRIKSNEIKGGWRVDVTRELLTPEELRLLHSKESVQSSVKNNPRVMQDEFIPNPRYPAHIISKFWAVAKGAGKVITGIGLYIDAASLNTEYQTSRESGDYNNTHTEAARIVGGWSGAYTAGTAGVKLGVAACAPFGIYASAACGFVSGLVSSFVGYQAGGKFSTYIFDESKKCFAKFDIKTESVDPKLQTLANHKLLLTPKKSMKELNMFGSQTSEQERKQQQISEEYHQRLQASEEKSAAHFREEILSRTVSDNKSSIPITTSMSVTSSSSHQVTKISTKRGQSHAPSTTPIVNEDKSVRPIPSQEDKQIADFLITWGAKPADVVKLYQKAPDWEMAKRAVAKFNELELKMEQQRNQQRCLEFFNGASVVCTALSQSNNRELARVGTIALPVLSL
ncbi:MAG: hypothetical protein JO131_06670, partial [Gammaproteobacteria bacterium]|nr:hypothetical protein [Gammaproteobacteria bacterium]